MPPVAAEFAVGDRLQAGGFLACHCIAYRAVLLRAQRLGGEFASLGPGARLAQLRRAQQAADLVGAERRFHLDAFRLAGFFFATAFSGTSTKS